MSTEPIDALIEMTSHIRAATGAGATVLRMHPATREQIATLLLRRRRDTLPPVLAAMHDRERKRRNRRKQARRIKRGHR